MSAFEETSLPFSCAELTALDDEPGYSQAECAARLRPQPYSARKSRERAVWRRFNDAKPFAIRPPVR